MDDGDDKFIRMTPASSGPPEYESIEGLSKDQSPTGDVKIPHNELIRLRTRTGHQILLHTSEDLIYIGNARGTTWIELTSNGKIDIFAEDSISIHTKNDLNIKADRDINMEAGRNVNIKAAAQFQSEAGTDYKLVVTGNGFITTTGNLQVNTTGLNNFTSTSATNIKSSANINLTSAANTNVKAGAKLTQNATAYYSLPGGGGIGAVTAVASAASKASALSTFTLPNGESTISSIMKRVPMHEPWQHHEHLNPLFMTSSATDRENSEAIGTPPYYNKYTTATDTFDPPPPAADENQA
jgi:hypothetical protein